MSISVNQTSRISSLSAETWGTISRQLFMRNVWNKTQLIVAVVSAVDLPSPEPWGHCLPSCRLCLTREQRGRGPTGQSFHPLTDLRLTQSTSIGHMHSVKYSVWGQSHSFSNQVMPRMELTAWPHKERPWHQLRIRNWGNPWRAGDSRIWDHYPLLQLKPVSYQTTH